MSNGRSGIYWAFVIILIVAYFILTMGLGWEGVPDLLTVAVLLAARRLPGAGAAAFGLAVGLIRDAVAVDHFGADALVLTVLSYLGARSRDLFEGDSLLFTSLYLFLGKWLHDLALGLITRTVPPGGTVQWVLVDRPLAGLYAALGGLVALILYRMATRTR